MSSISISVDTALVPSYETEGTVSVQFWFSDPMATNKDTKKLTAVFEEATEWMKSEKIKFKRFGQFSYIIFMQERDAMRLKLRFG